MVGRLITVTTRHEDKMAVPGVKIIPGSEEDLRLPLSWKGVENAIRAGQEGNVVPHGFDTVLVSRSTLMRTTETMQALLAGAGYDPDNTKQVLWDPERSELGLACGALFGHPSIPKYSPRHPDADIYAQHLLTRHWLPCPPAAGEEPQRFPVMSGLAYQLVEDLITNVSNALSVVRDGRKVVVAQATHGPFVEALSAALYNTVRVGEDGHCELVDFPGAYDMGMNIIGEATIGLDTGNPRFVFMGHSNRAVETTLDDLKVLRDDLYKASDGGRTHL